VKATKKKEEKKKNFLYTLYL